MQNKRKKLVSNKNAPAFCWQLTAIPTGFDPADAYINRGDNINRPNSLCRRSDRVETPKPLYLGLWDLWFQVNQVDSDRCQHWHRKHKMTTVETASTDFRTDQFIRSSATSSHTATSTCWQLLFIGCLYSTWVGVLNVVVRTVPTKCQLRFMTIAPCTQPIKQRIICSVK